jgi:segregation and condensation protein B
MDEGMSEEFQQQADLTDINSEQRPESQNIEEPAATEETGQQTITTESVIEAILFASDEPLSAERLVVIAELNGGVKQVKKCIEILNQQYQQNGRAFRIEEIAGGYQMMTLPDYNVWLKKLLRERGDNKLTPAALETLAIIAYKQPVIRADIEAIRGVACGELIRSLMYKGLVKIVGKAEILGRPLLYGTTRKFLEVFGLNDLKDLPKAEELKQPQQ